MDRQNALKSLLRRLNYLWGEDRTLTGLDAKSFDYGVIIGFIYALSDCSIISRVEESRLHDLASNALLHSRRREFRKNHLSKAGDCYVDAK